MSRARRENDDDFRRLSLHEVSRKNQKSKGLRQTKGPTVKRSLAGNYYYNTQGLISLEPNKSFSMLLPRKNSHYD